MTEPGLGSPSASRRKAEIHRAHAEALRFVLAQLDRAEGLPADLPGALPSDVLMALAMLVTGARRAVAQMRGITDPADQAADVRSALHMELEEAEMRVMFDDIEAEERGG